MAEKGLRNYCIIPELECAADAVPKVLAYLAQDAYPLARQQERMMLIKELFEL